MFDLTEWHLPRYPWDWVVKHCKDLLLPHLWWRKKQLTKAEWMIAWLLSANCDLKEWIPNEFCVSFPLGTAHASVNPSWLLPKHYWTFIARLYCLLALTILSLPSLLFVPFFPLSLRLPLSLINTYCRPYVSLANPQGQSWKERQREGNKYNKKVKREINWARAKLAVTQKQIKRQMQIVDDM